MKILVINYGSSSQKSCLYNVGTESFDAPTVPLWEAQVNWMGPKLAAVKVKTSTGVTFCDCIPTPVPLDCIGYLLETITHGGTQVIDRLDEIQVVGHRVVHGGNYCESMLITDAVKAEIHRLAVFAPLHNPVNLAGIAAIEKLLGKVPQVAVFDTAFHRQLPEAAKIYPLPYELYTEGIQRYGFHGISHQYCALRSAQLLERPLEELRLIICHLGNGSSLAAVKNGHSIDTTMGFTPLDGLMMETRSGSIDPGIVLYLLRRGHSAEDINELLNQASGLEGVSGISSDLRQIHDAIAEGNQRAQLALDMYVHSVRSHIGSMLASLQGMDALVFTGGIGQHDARLRALVCEGFGFLGMAINPATNQRPPTDRVISKAQSKIPILLVETQENWAIAKDCWRLMAS
jgi:acetate kinase